MSVDVSKEGGYVVIGPDDVQVVEKLNSYVVVGPDAIQMIDKLNAYVIVGPITPVGYKKQHDVVFNGV